VTIDLDRELDGIVAGDPDAFGRWVAGAEAPLRATLGSMAAHVDCEAVLQEALLRVWQVAPKCRRDGRDNALLRLASRIARNLGIDELRKTRRMSPADAGELEAAMAANEPGAPREVDPLLRQAIEDCRKALPGKPAAALAARVESGGGEADALVAARVKMRPNTFLQNVSRARKLIAECLRRRGVDVAELLP
jgi:RNA polymerase sigma-70 factor (ECF subfamily)